MLGKLVVLVEMMLWQEAYGPYVARGFMFAYPGLPRNILKKYKLNRTYIYIYIYIYTYIYTHTYIQTHTHTHTHTHTYIHVKKVKFI